MRAILFAVLAGLASGVLAQGVGCDTPESHELDFWLGEWDLSFVRDGKTVTSRNRVTKILDGCAVLEEFAGSPGTKLDGRSLSLYDRASKQWRQVWVDNTGSWLDFTAARVEGDFAFVRGATHRMVFREVKPASLKWLWQATTDGGRTWTTQWEIDYRRAK